MPVHVKILPKVKLGQVEVDSNIAKNHIAHRKSYLLFIYTYDDSYDDMHDSGDTAH